MALLVPISDVPAHDRPRERLHAHGAGQLADTELLALVLGSGTGSRGVIALAAALLARFGDLRGLAESALPELCDEHGIGPARAAVIQAAFELGRRAAGARPQRGQRLGHATEVWTHFRARLATTPVEEFWVLGLDVRHRLMTEACAARGALTSVDVHPRDVFRPLIRAGVAAVVFCHNHPSGDPTPSRIDVELTGRLRDVGQLCGIQVLDHVIVGAEGFVSLAARGWV